LPAVADIQNSIVKEFAGDPRVVTAVLSQDEAKDTLETFWLNVYLRGVMIYDADGAIALDTYGQPAVDLPASRWFVIGPDQTVVLPQYGYNPDLVVDTIRGLLVEMNGTGDFDDDMDVDAGDFDEFDLCFSGAGGGILTGCEAGDLDGDADVDCEDWYDFVLAWTASSPLPSFTRCPAALETTLDAVDIVWPAAPRNLTYDVSYGDLHALRTTLGDFSSSAGGCLQGGMTGTSVAHGSPPSSGKATWYLVRAVTSSGAATYDSLASSQLDRRDAGIAASGLDCP